MSGESERNQRAAERKERERRAISRAQAENRFITYIDDDGCEVTATPSGHAWYNAADWY